MYSQSSANPWARARRTYTSAGSGEHAWLVPFAMMPARSTAAVRACLSRRLCATARPSPSVAMLASVILTGTPVSCQLCVKRTVVMPCRAAGVFTMGGVGGRRCKASLLVAGEVGCGCCCLLCSHCGLFAGVGMRNMFRMTSTAERSA